MEHKEVTITRAALVQVENACGLAKDATTAATTAH